MLAKIHVWWSFDQIEFNGLNYEAKILQTTVLLHVVYFYIKTCKGHISGQSPETDCTPNRRVTYCHFRHKFNQNRESRYLFVKSWMDIFLGFIYQNSGWFSKSFPVHIWLFLPKIKLYGVNVIKLGTNIT